MTPATEGKGARPVVFVHIGAPKTGTTYLQNLLWHNRAALRSDGMLFPGDARYAQVWATLDLRGIDFKGHRGSRTPNAWNRMVEEIRTWDGPAILDQELLSPATEQHIDRALHDLDFAEVHLVYTARDMVRQLPAAWQEWVKNRESTTFADYLASVHAPDTSPINAGRRFWGLHDTPSVLARWSRTLSPHRVHVITVPQTGADPGLLWQRFAGVLGLDAQRYATDTGQSNTSLGAAEATVLRRLNAEMGEAAFPWPVYDRMIKHHLAPMLGRHPGIRIALPPAEYEWAAAWSEHTAKDIAQAGYDVIGDLDELLPGAPVSGLDPDVAPAEAQAQAAVTGMAALANFAADLHATGTGAAKKAQRAAIDARLAKAEDALREHRELPPGERVKRCVVELAGQVRWMGLLHRLYRRVRGRRG